MGQRNLEIQFNQREGKIKLKELEFCLGIPDIYTKKEVINALTPTGWHAVGEGRDCPDLLRTVRKVQPQLTIIDLSLQGKVTETAAILEEENVCGIILLAQNDMKFYRGIPLDELEYMVLCPPLECIVLSTASQAVTLEFSRRKKLWQEMNRLNEKLNARITIERAKGVVMKKYSLDEKQAHRYLQKKSMDLRIPLQMVAEEVFSQEARILD